MAMGIMGIMGIIGIGIIGIGETRIGISPQIVRVQPRNNNYWSHGLWPHYDRRGRHHNRRRINICWIGGAGVIRRTVQFGRK